MNLLFTPVGDTDPVREFHDGAVLHIIRHYDIGGVVIFLTKDMAERKETFHCCSEGIRSVRPDCRITWIRSGTADPHRYDSLTVIQKEFGRCFQEEPDSRWFLNVSSGTPQIKTVMAMLAVDYPSCTAVQVSSPEQKSSRSNAPCSMEEWKDMIEGNEDAQEGAPNRCTEPPLRILKRHGIRLQIESLVSQYEYRGALQLLEQNRDMFSETSGKLLRHAVYRSNLMWKKANEEMADYHGKALIFHPGDFSEYFQVMEMRQRKGQMADFLAKLSPVLMTLGIKYVESLPGFRLQDCLEPDRSWEKGSRKKEEYPRMRLSRRRINTAYPQLLFSLDGQYRGGLRDGDDLNFDILIKICEYLQTIVPWNHSEKHEKVLSLFKELRQAEEAVRNPIAHAATNMTEEKIQELISDNHVTEWNSSTIMQKLHETVVLVYGRDIHWSYPELNQMISESLHGIT